ncbi:hypothetical protein HO404_04955 [Streptococcus suis]|nr:hypothetical protein [Streptococcus suis]NQP30907.1 hypothetical protein [Streptococcus suis]NQP35671.1 hypothetical protein [Streptococcus suis]HEM3624145.1 hypothetical protein [Streptococcus suis]
MFDTVVLDPLEINLDFNNPRFSMFDFSTEEEIVKYLVDFEQIKELAFQIGENGYNTIGERIIVLKSRNAGKINYTVLEGNRRVASLKLLFQYSSLLTSSERKKLEQLNLNLKDFEVSCDVVNEDTREEALFKISAKHVDGIKTWSATDKRVFYHNLYTQYRKKGLSSDEALAKIKNITPEGKVAIRNAIQQLNYLTSVYNATQIYKSDLEKLAHLDTDVLVSRVLRPLLKELNLEFNDEFQVTAKNEKVYHEILGLLGKAVWIDKKLDTRVFSVQGQWNEIVKNDKVIPGLAEKINEYKEYEKTKGSNEESSKNNPISSATETTEDNVGDNKEAPDLPVNDTRKNTTNNNDIQNIETKYKFFVSKQSVTIEQRNYNLVNNIELVDNEGNRVTKQSSEYNKISISCADRNIVIKNNVIDSISENGQYTIDVEYSGETKQFVILLNITIVAQQEDYQVLFNQQWYDESLSKLSSNPKYSKICAVLRKLQEYNTLSHDIGSHLIIIFLLRTLFEYSSKAYADLFLPKQEQGKLPPLVSSIRSHLFDNKLITQTEMKSIKNTDDIDMLNSQIHDYTTSTSSIAIQTVCSKYEKFFSVVFNRLHEGVNNG